MSSACIFCAIVDGVAPAHTVYEDEQLLAFLDLFPVHRGHLLIIPKHHSDDIFTADPEAIAAVARLSVPLARVLDRVVEADGISIHQLNRAAAGQTVFHYHMHLIPQTEGQTLQIHGRAQGDDRELADLARTLSCELQAELEGMG